MATPKRTQNRNQNQNRGDPRAKKCTFCDPSTGSGQGTLYIDYKDYGRMKPFTDYFGNIRARYYSGVCLRHQKMLKGAVEKARFMGMLSYRK
jgi:small subunit ribosomal protein S18